MTRFADTLGLAVEDLLASGPELVKSEPEMH
jgi:hypothetical protein